MEKETEMDEDTEDPTGRGEASISPSATAFFNRMFIFDSLARPSCHDMLADPYLNSDVMTNDDYYELMSTLKQRIDESKQNR